MLLGLLWGSTCLLGGHGEAGLEWQLGEGLGWIQGVWAVPILAASPKTQLRSTSATENFLITREVHRHR